MLGGKFSASWKSATDSTPVTTQVICANITITFIFTIVAINSINVRPFQLQNSCKHCNVSHFLFLLEHDEEHYDDYFDHDTCYVHNNDGDNEKRMNLFTFLQTACYPPLDLFCQLFRCSPETQILNTVFQKDNVSLGKHQLIFDLIWFLATGFP